MAWRRPYYLDRALESWANADGIKDIRRFIVGLGPSDKTQENLQVIDKWEGLMGREIEVKPDSPRAIASPAMHRPMGEAVCYAWEDPDVDWVILSEEDNEVSNDIFHYMKWSQRTFQDNEAVLLVCAHNLPWLPGFVGPAPSDKGTKPNDDPDEDETIVRLKRGFDSHAWGSWRERWAEVLEPTWDYECNSGGPTTSGCDWQIATRVMPRGGYLAVTPDASRSANYGRDEGVYMVAGDKPVGWSSANSFRMNRTLPQHYRFVNE
jgi:hypothetical protein